MLSRIALLGLLLLAGNIFIGERMYRLWKGWPWEIDQAQLSGNTSTRPDSVQEPKGGTSIPQQFASTELIIAKNLFDPDRGATIDKDKETEAQALAQIIERMQSIVLVGTILLGDSRYVIVEDSGDSRPADSRPQGARKGQTRRLKLGDTIEGFQLSEIDDRKIVFSKGATRVDVAIDYFRKVEDRRQVGTAPTPAGARPRAQGVQPSPAPVAPRVPRRELANRG